jgi:hypothetical protein
MIPLYSNASIRIGAIVAFILICAVGWSTLSIDNHGIHRFRNHEHEVAEYEHEVPEYENVRQDPPPPSPPPQATDPPPPPPPPPPTIDRFQDVYNATLGVRNSFIFSEILFCGGNMLMFGMWYSSRKFTSCHYRIGEIRGI